MNNVNGSPLALTDETDDLVPTPPQGWSDPAMRLAAGSASGFPLFTRSPIQAAPTRTERRKNPTSGESHWRPPRLELISASLERILSRVVPKSPYCSSLTSGILGRRSQRKLHTSNRSPPNHHYRPTEASNSRNGPVRY